MDVFFAYRDAPERRAALAAHPGALERYRLFGLDELAARGARVRHNLERRAPSSAVTLPSKAINAALYRAGGYGGDFATVLSSLRAANAADVILSTVDTVGLPLALLKRGGIVRTPIVYISIGLRERLEQLRGNRMRALYRSALRGCRALVAYGAEEVERLRAWLGDGAPPVHFIRFGVNVEGFRPVDVKPEVDVLSVGVDPRRDFPLLLEIAKRRSELRFRLVAGSENARLLGDLPGNVEVETDLPLEQVRERFASARLVALPVRDNTYSGATTTLLQAMAMAKAVVVSRTAAIATGYELRDGVNCRLVPPGDVDAFESAVVQTLTGADAATALGTRARQTVERSLSWTRYVDALWEILSAS